MLQNFITLLSSGRKQVKSLRTGFPVFTSSGEEPNPKCWVGQVTTDSSGNATVNYSSASFNSIYSVNCIAVVAGATILTAPLVSLTSLPTTTSVSLMTIESKTTGVLILNTSVQGLQAAPSVTVYVTVWGN